MDEQPKSIWKKSRQKNGWFRAWLIVSGATFLIIFLIGALTGNIISWGEWQQALLFTFIISVIIATVSVCLWLFIRWISRRGNFSRFLFGLACFATLLALFYAEEDWRGKHDWEKFKREWEAKGEHFDWQSVVPPPVPDDENFAFSPVWMAEEKYNFQNRLERAEAWYGNRIYSEEVSNIFFQLPVGVSGLVGTNWAYHLPNTPEMSGSWAKARVTDLKPWQSYYRDLETSNPTAQIPITPQPQTPAQDVLLALSKFDPVIEKLRADSAATYSRFPVQYGDDDPAGILLPHLAAVKRYSQALQLRTIAELQNGQSENALADVKLALRLTDSIRSEPFLISHLVYIAVVQITLQPVYEGLAQHQWSDAQLAALDAELSKLDFLADYRLAMRGEMGFQGRFFDYLRHHPDQAFNVAGDNYTGRPPAFPARVVAWLIPTGWYYQNQLHCARPMVDFYLPVADLEQSVISPAKIRAADAALQADTKTLTPYNLIERLLLPALGNSAKKFAYAQAAVGLARTAIALERYHLAHGEFPESLDVLAPQFIAQLPHDVINGEPLHYRRTDDGQFVLYSVGWNETDDGGVIVMGKGKSPSIDTSKGDWVWRYPIAE